MSRQTRAIDACRGFTLIEALVALLVMAFGMLSLVGMQSMLARSADVAKQQSEAVRLAQEKMECLRSYTQIVGSAASSASTNCMGSLLAVDTWNGMATVSSDPLNPLTSPFSNTSYSRSWTIGGTTADPFRPLTVTVTWTDRTGNSQSYSMSSVISQSNPNDEGSIGFPLAQNTNLKRPKNRNLNIPVPATDLGSGKSAYQINSTLAVVFSNDSGYVIQKCNTVVTAANYASLVAGGQCSNYPAYVIAGYISGDSSWTGTVANSLPTGINTASLTGWDSSGGRTISCSYSATAQATDQNTGAAVAGVFRYYLCVIPIVTGAAYSGTVRLAGMTGGAGGAATSAKNWLVCRFQYAASTLWPSDNDRNVQPYTHVSSSLDSQNYYITSTTGSCPAISDTTGNGASQQSTTVQTVSHQDCRTGFAAADCPAAFSGP